MGHGRPTKLSPEVQERICDALLRGNNRVASAAVGGVTYKTFLNWIHRGEAARKEIYSGATVDDSELNFLHFFEGVEKAEGLARAHAVERLLRAGKEATEGQWQALAWWLERKFPQQWGRIDRKPDQRKGGAGDKVVINVARSENGTEACG